MSVNENELLQGVQKTLEQHKKGLMDDLANFAKGEDLKKFQEKHEATTSEIEKSMKEMQSEIVKQRNALISQEMQDKSTLFKSINDFAPSFEEVKSKLYAGEKLITKAVGTITVANNMTGQVTRFDQRPGIAGPMHTSVRVRNLLRITTANSNEYNFRKGVKGEGDIAPVAEAATKPQVDYDFTNTATPVRKLAGYADIGMESLDDTDDIESFINNELMQDLMDVEDNQLLYGAGTGENIAGLSGTASDATDIGATVIYSNPQNWDALLAAMGVLAGKNYMPTVILLSPTDYYVMIGNKGTDGHYLQKELVFQGGTPYLYGTPIYVSTEVVAGEFFMWDQRAAEVAMRKTIEIARSTENGTNFIDNKETFRIEERLALAKIYEDAVFYDTFADVITAITS